MSKLPWTPWHQVVTVRDDLKSGELSLAVFAADLYDVVMHKARRVYQDPAEFFALTYPTFNLRELSKDVVLRLAGKNDKAIRQLELTYGGGKTHTLITLYHLTNQPEALPSLPAVQEFIQHIGQLPPKARIAVLPFDKLDVEKGMEVRAPNGETRWLKHPWSVLAFQIAGGAGLRLLSASGSEEERDSAPAENLLETLLALPTKEDLATLVLIDEVLMYAREKVGLDRTWQTRLVNFFQYLTQAATKVDRCAIVASLLATDPAKSDTLGKEVMNELSAIFRREREESVQPVVKDDVAEVLRRRFFTPESIRDREAFRPHVVAALKGIGDLDSQTQKDGKAAEDRYTRSYPFHPDLTDIFYSKWGNLEGFQRTRGVLRTFALALRNAERWDDAPLVAANVFLGQPGTPGLSEAARELTNIAATEEYEGKRQEWMTIIEGELAKAREIQLEFAGVRHREVEQAVFATFLHSQPIGQKALLRDLLVLLGHTRPDKIELEKALHRWIELSWFLDESAMSDAAVGADGKRQLPKSWRLGSKPNLRQMHHDAVTRVSSDVIEARLIDEIGKLKSLTTGASAAGAIVHTLPLAPSNIKDDGDFHYGVLGPKAASEPGKPSAEARKFVEESTPGQPRTYRNAVVLAVPSRDGLDLARNSIRTYISWEEVRAQLKDQALDPIRDAMLADFIDRTRKSIPDALAHAYSIVVTVSDKNDVEAFKVTPGSEPLFTIIKKDPKARIQETAINAEALLPEGPYDLWREDEPSRRVKDLVSAFAQFPRLPKMLKSKATLDTIVEGCRQGIFVLRLQRPDRSIRTFWRETPDDLALKDPGLEVLLPGSATLMSLAPSLLAPGVLPGLWPQQGDAITKDVSRPLPALDTLPAITVRRLQNYFSGTTVAKIQREGYEEPIAIPCVEPEALETAITSAIQSGLLWLTSGPSSIYKESVPAGILTADALLQPPPPAISTLALLPPNLPTAWVSGDTTSVTAIADALAQVAGKPLPWTSIRDTINGAINARLLERVPGSAPWPCDRTDAWAVTLRLPVVTPTPSHEIHHPKPPVYTPNVLVAEADLDSGQIQDLADKISELTKAAVGTKIRLRLRVELGDPATKRPPEESIAAINELLAEISEQLHLK